eukprot:scaffold1958_cov34-Tisochrysis_lutea.AAC.3
MRETRESCSLWAVGGGSAGESRWLAGTDGHLDQGSGRAAEGGGEGGVAASRPAREGLDRRLQDQRALPQRKPAAARRGLRWLSHCSPRPQSLHAHARQAAAMPARLLAVQNGAHRGATMGRRRSTSRGEQGHALAQ